MNEQAQERLSVGRPPVGPVITLRLTPEDLVAVDQAASEEGVNRAEWLRRAAADRLQITRSELSGFVEWLLTQGGFDAADISDAIEKPYKFRDYRAAFRLGVDLDEVESLMEFGENFPGGFAESIGEAQTELAEWLAHRRQGGT